jgi:hypothetical protein
MAKSEAKKVELAKLEDTPGAEALVKHVAQRRKWLGQAAAKATKDGALDASDPKYRTARKRVKRAQRRLRSVRARVAQLRIKVGAPKADAAAPS